MPSLTSSRTVELESDLARGSHGTATPIYDAFISYSHAKDKPIATALQSVVQKLGKSWYRRRALRVFRDDTGLTATPHLWPSSAISRCRTRTSATCRMPGATLPER